MSVGNRKRRRSAGAAAPSANIQYVGGRTQTWQGTTSTTSVSLTGLTGGLASSPAAGDLVIIAYSVAAVSDLDLTIAVDWTELVDLYSNDDADSNLAVFYKIMGGSPDTSVLLGQTYNVNDPGAVAVQVWRGVDPTTPFDVTTTTATGINSQAANPPAITPITAGAVIVAAGSGAQVSGAAPRTFSSADLTMLTVGVSDGPTSVIGLGYSEDWVSGSFDPATWTLSNSDSSTRSWCAATMALRPA